MDFWDLDLLFSANYFVVPVPDLISYCFNLQVLRKRQKHAWCLRAVALYYELQSKWRKTVVMPAPKHFFGQFLGFTTLYRPGFKKKS